jgi:hypothetical protein
MINERTGLIAKLIGTHLLMIPLLILISFFVSSDFFLLISICQTLIFILFLTGYWEFLGTRFRIIYSTCIEIFLLLTLIWKLFSKQPAVPNHLLISILVLVQIFMIYELIKILVVIFMHDKNKVNISFPFMQGTYLVTDGGNSKISRIMNYHYYSPVHKRKGTNNSMLFATDIVKTGSSRSFFPLQNSDYPIFGEKVFSPVSGIVLKVENSIDDNIPYIGNYPYNTGNTIVIRKDNYYMLLGHLKKRSIKVEPGSLVNEGDLLAEAGNSGYSERPHIHMQLIKSDTDNYWKGIGVSIEFGGKNLFKNRLIKLT